MVLGSYAQNLVVNLHLASVARHNKLCPQLVQQTLWHTEAFDICTVLAIKLLVPLCGCNTCPPSHRAASRLQVVLGLF